MKGSPKAKKKKTKATAVCAHEWGTDGMHLNEFCKKCFMDKPKNWKVTMKDPAALTRSALVEFVRQIQKGVFSIKREDWGANHKINTFNEIVSALHLCGLHPMEEDEQEKCFAVYIHDEKRVKYLVAAPDAETARRNVEASECADTEFSRIPIVTQWHVDHVEEEKDE